MQTYNLGTVTKSIYDSGISFFPLKTLQDLLAISVKSSLYKVVERLVGSGVLIKAERDKYIVSNYKGSEFAIAHFIYEPSYISFESALSFYGILSQFPYETTSATTKQTKSKEYGNKWYGYYHIKNDLFWGYEKKDNYLIATKEKALLDQLYLFSKGIKQFPIDEYNLSSVNLKILTAQRNKYPNTKLFNQNFALLSSKLIL
jgi:predicted transcriptional regulator of viral defense system